MKTEYVFTDTLPRHNKKVWRLKRYLPNTLTKYIKNVWRLKLYLPIRYRVILKKYEDGSSI